MGILLLALTVFLSLMMIHSPGTSDVPDFSLKWMEVVYRNGLVDGYSIISGLDGDYPPVTFAILYVARDFGSAVGLSPFISFKIAIVTFQLVSVGIILLLSCSYWIAAAFNASLLLGGVALGYMDVFVAPSLIAAFWAFKMRRNVLGAAFFLIACLTKWQPLVVAPFIAVYLLEIYDLRSFRSAVGTRLFWHLAILVAATIALLCLLFGLAPVRSLWHGMNHAFLSGNALNLPWVASFFYKLLFSSSFSMQTELTKSISSSIYLMPIRLIFWIIFGAVIVRAMRSEKTFENCLLFSVVGFVTYVIWASGVHENHLFVAVILAYLLMLHERTREHWAIATILAVMLNINMFVFYGVTGTQLQSRVVGVDVSVILAMLYAIAWLLLALYACGVWQPKKQGERAERETHLPAARSK